MAHGYILYFSPPAILVWRSGVIEAAESQPFFGIFLMRRSNLKNRGDAVCVTMCAV